MTTDPTAGPSGSRWEPAPASSSTAELRTSGYESPAGPAGDPAASREESRRRWPVVAFLVTLLTLGTGSAGLAWSRAQDHRVVDPTASTSGAPFAGGDHERGTGRDGGQPA